MLSDAAKADRVERIRSCLLSAFNPTSIEIIDDSHKHAGHAGAKDGRGHFRVNIVAERFAGTKTIERHRMVYAALGNMMQTDIHALSVTAATPAERQP